MPFGKPVASANEVMYANTLSSGITITASYAIKQSSRLLKVRCFLPILDDVSNVGV